MLLNQFCLCFPRQWSWQRQKGQLAGLLGWHPTGYVLVFQRSCQESPQCCLLSPNPFSEFEGMALPAPGEASCPGRARPEKLPSDPIVCVLGQLPRLRHLGCGCGRALFWSHLFRVGERSQISSPFPLPQTPSSMDEWLLRDEKPEPCQTSLLAWQR